MSTDISSQGTFAVFGAREDIESLFAEGWEMSDRHSAEGRIPWFAGVGGDGLMVEMASALTSAASILAIAESLRALRARIQNSKPYKIAVRIGYMDGKTFETLEIDADWEVEEVVQLIQALRDSRRGNSR